MRNVGMAGWCVILCRGFALQCFHFKIYLSLYLLSALYKKIWHCPIMHHEVAVVFYEIMIVITNDSLIYKQGNEKQGNVIL